MMAQSVVNRQSPFLASRRQPFDHELRADDDRSVGPIKKHVRKSHARVLLRFLREGARKIVDMQLALPEWAVVAALAATKAPLGIRPVQPTRELGAVSGVPKPVDSLPQHTQRSH